MFLRNNILKVTESQKQKKKKNTRYSIGQISFIEERKKIQIFQDCLHIFRKFVAFALQE